MEIKKTDRETVSDFRSHHLLDASLIWDSWDEVSRHFATFENGAIVSTLRVSSEIGLRLPFHDAANICLPIEQGSVEIGRALSIAHRKALNGFTSWLRWMYESPDRSLYVEPIAQQIRSQWHHLESDNVVGLIFLI